MLHLMTSTPFPHIVRIATSHSCNAAKLTFAYCGEANTRTVAKVTIVYCSEANTHAAAELISAYCNEANTRVPQ